LKNVDRIH